MRISNPNSLEELTKMRIDDYEFEEEKTLLGLADFLEKIAQDIRNGDKVEIPMPSLKEGFIVIPLGEPVETGIEVNLRRSYIHVHLNLAWKTFESGSEAHE
jgi:hypothetical protein